MREDTNSNDLQEIITQAIEEIKNEQGDSFDLQKINLAELSRRTNISRSKLRRLKKNGFKVKPHASTGRKAKETVLSVSIPAEFPAPVRCEEITIPV